jgi:hypothetical protein
MVVAGLAMADTAVAEAGIFGRRCNVRTRVCSNQRVFTWGLRTIRYSSNRCTNCRHTVVRETPQVVEEAPKVAKSEPEVVEKTVQVAKEVVEEVEEPKKAEVLVIKPTILEPMLIAEPQGKPSVAPSAALIELEAQKPLAAKKVKESQEKGPEGASKRPFSLLPFKSSSVQGNTPFVRPSPTPPDRGGVQWF